MDEYIIEARILQLEDLSILYELRKAPKKKISYLYCRGIHVVYNVPWYLSSKQGRRYFLRSEVDFLTNKKETSLRNIPFVLCNSGCPVA